MLFSTGTHFLSEQGGMREVAHDFVLDARLMAARRCKPPHVLFHSDQGSQFGSDAWRRFCRAHHLEPA